MRDEVQNAFNCGRNLHHTLRRRWGREPPRLGLLNGRHVAFDGGVCCEHAVQHAIEWSTGDDATVLALERSRSRVSRVGKWGFVGSDLGRIQCFKLGPRKENFPADFQRLRSRFVQLKGNALDGSNICGDVLPYCAVASGQGALKLPFLVLQSNGHAIVFQLHDKFHLLAFENLVCTLRPISDVLCIVGIGE